MTNKTELDLTPNYSRIFAQFLADARTQGLHLRERLPHDPAAAAGILRALQGPLASLGIAAASLTSTDGLEQFRTVLGEIVTYVNSTAARLENIADETMQEVK